MAAGLFSGFLSQWWRVGGILGIGFTALFIIGGALIGASPTFDDPIDEARSYFVDHGTRVLVADYIFTVAFVLLLPSFLMALRGVLSRVEGRPNLLSWLSLVGGLLISAIASAAVAAWGALALIAEADAEVSDSIVRTLMYGSARADAMASMGLALLLFPASATIFRTGVFWRWLAFLGLAVGVLGVIGGAWIIDGDSKSALYFIGAASLVGLPLWVLLISINMLLKRELPPQVERRS